MSMVKAAYSDKQLVVDLLSEAFDTNNSVNFIVKQDKKRKERVKHLMAYAFDMCQLFGEVYLSADRKACALMFFPEKKRNTAKSLCLDIKLAFNCIGISNIAKVLKREGNIKKFYPKEHFSYLWFIGVRPSDQGKGLGESLLKELIQLSESRGRPFYLETSMKINVNFYKKLGFEIYNELKKPHHIFLLRKK
ncbi:GNAT family N-acetyltransferase [Cytophagaceae bacterium ABcell3]|nr:GNAT family N-acetyltransferase [Cytophagaceae bacterium ABcell3]